MANPSIDLMDSSGAVFPYVRSMSKVKEIQTRVQEVLEKEREWRRRARASIRQYHWGEDQRYEPYSDLHNGHFTTNMTFAYIRTIIPSAAFQNPKVVVAGMDDESEMAAPILEAVLNRELEATDAVRALRRALLSACVLARGYCKIGYHSEFGTRPEVLDPRRKKSMEIEFDEYILEESAFIKHVSTFNIVRDPMVDSIHEGRWLAERFVRPLQSLKNDRRFINIDKVRVGSAFMGTDEVMDSDWDWQSGAIDSPIWNRVHRNETMDNPIEYYSFWDKETRKIYTVQESVDDWIMPPRDWELDVGGFPYEEMFLYDVPEDNMGTSIVEQIAWHQYEINSIRRFQTDLVKRQNSQIAIDPAAGMSPDDKDLMVRGVPAAIVEMKDPGRNMKAVEQPKISGDNYSVVAAMMNDLDLITGIGKPSLGGTVPGATRRTATENMREQAGFQVRIDDIVQEVERFGSRCAEKMAAVITSMYDADDVVRVAGPDGSKFVPFIGTNLVGRYQFTVEMGSTTPGSEAIRKKQVLDAWSLFAEHPEIFNLKEIAKRVLKVMPELGRDVDKLLITPQEMLQDQIQEQLVGTMSGAIPAGGEGMGMGAPPPPMMPEGAPPGEGSGGEGASVNGLRQGTEIGSDGLEGLVSRAMRLTQ